MEEYLIFSDESGSWSRHNRKKEPPIYVRAWVKIKKEDCEQLDLRSSIDNILKQNKIEAFFTFTCLEEFYARKFQAREDNIAYIENAISTLEQRAYKNIYRKFPKK